jgi:hypothetical protein
MTKCLTKVGRSYGWTPLVEADVMGNQYLGDYNERVEAGKDDRTAERLYAKGQFWLDRYNKLAGNA